MTSSFSFTSPSPSPTTRTRQHEHSASSSSPSPSSSFSPSSPSSSPLWSDLQDFVNISKIPIQQQETKFYANAFEEFKNEFLEAFVEFCTPAYVSYRDRKTEETSQETSSSLLTKEERHSIRNDFYRIETYGSYAQETLLNQQEQEDVLSSSSSSMNNCNKKEYDPRSIFRSPHVMMMNNNINMSNSNIKTLSSNLDICVFAKNIKTKWIPIIAQSKQMIIDELKRIVNRNNNNNDQDNENKTNTELYDKAFLQQLKSKFPHVDLTNASTTFCNNHHYDNKKQNHNQHSKTTSSSSSQLRFQDFPELLQKMSRQFIVGDDDYGHDADDENKNNNNNIGEEHSPSSSTFSFPLENHFMNEINLVTNWLHMKIQARATVKWMMMMMSNNNNHMYHSSQSSATMTVLLPHYNDHQENNDKSKSNNTEEDMRAETGFSSSSCSSFNSPKKLSINDRSSKSQVYSFLTIEDGDEKPQQSNNSTMSISELIINVTYSLHPPRAFLISKFCIEPKLQWNPDLKEFIILMKKLLLTTKSSSSSSPSSPPPSPYEITLLCMAIYETALLEDDKVTHFEYLRNKQLEQEEERKKAMDDFRFTVSSSPSPAMTTTPSSSPSSSKKKKHHDYIDDDDDDQNLGGSSSASSAWMKFPSPHSSSSPSSCEFYYSLHDILTMTEENRNHINNFSPPQLHRHRHFAECTANITDKLYQSRCRFAVYNTTTSKTSSPSPSQTTKRHTTSQQPCLRPKISLFTLLWNFLKTFCYNSSPSTTDSTNGAVEEMTVIFSHEAFYSLCGKAQFSFDEEDENDDSGGSSFIHSSCRILPSEAPVLKTFVMQHLPHLAADDILLNVQQQHQQNTSSSSSLSSPTPRIIQQEIIFERNNPEFLTWQANNNTKFDHHQRSRNYSGSSSSFSTQKYTRFSNINNNNINNADDEYAKLLSFEKTISPHLARAFVKYQRHRKMKELHGFGKSVFDHILTTTSSASSSSFSRIASTYQQEPYFSTDEVTTFNWMKLISEASLCYDPAQPKTTSSNNTSSSLSSLSSLQRTIIETYQDCWFSTYMKHPLIQLKHNLSCNRHIDYYFMMQHYNQKRIPIRIKQCIQRPISRLETPHMGNVLLSVMMMNKNNNNQQQQSPSSSTTSDNHHHQSLLPNAPCKAPYNTNNNIHDHDEHEKLSSLEQRKSVGHLLLHSSSSPSSSEQEIIKVDQLKREEKEVARIVVVRSLEFNNDNNNDNNHDDHHPKTAPASVRVSVERQDENDAENKCNNNHLAQTEQKKNELKYFDLLQLRLQQEESSLSSYFNNSRMPSSIRAPSSSSSLSDKNNKQNETNNNFRINTPMHDRCDNKLDYDRERSKSPSIRIPFEDDDYLFNNSKNDHNRESKNHFHSSTLSSSSLPRSNRSSQRRTVVRFVDIDDDDDCQDHQKK